MLAVFPPHFYRPLFATTGSRRSHCSRIQLSRTEGSAASQPARENRQRPAGLHRNTIAGLTIVNIFSGKISYVVDIFLIFYFFMGVLGPGRFSKGSAAIFRFVSTYLELQISILDLIYPHGQSKFTFKKTPHIIYVSLNVPPSSLTTPIFSVST